MPHGSPGAILTPRWPQESKIDPKVISRALPGIPKSSVFDGIHSVSARSPMRAKSHARRFDEALVRPEEGGDLWRIRGLATLITHNS